VKKFVEVLRRWLKPPRRLRILRPGGFLITGVFGLGFATLNTGNNLLYLLMGALLGIIALSGWLSEQALRRLRIVRRVPRPAVAREHARIEYEVRNDKRRLPSHGVIIRERAARLERYSDGYVAALDPGATMRARALLRADRRGVYALEGLTLSTSFPFGLFAKERDIDMPATLIVWPRTDRPVRAPRTGGARGRRAHAGSGATRGAERGEYRGLREYRPGDDPRDVHWRSSARRGDLIVREYDRDASDEYWIVVDTIAPEPEAGERALEVAASLVALAARRGDNFGVAAGSVRIPPGGGISRVDAALDMLAAVQLSTSGPSAAPPVSHVQCVLVTSRSGAGDWGDVYHVSARDE